MYISTNNMSASEKTLVVVGGGAAGFFCAVNAARLVPSLRVVLLEKSNKLLSKVKISGGGRCNVTHECFEIGELSKRYPRGQHFLKKAFHWFSAKDTIRWFEDRGVDLVAEADGRMFPSTHQSQTIIDCLLAEASSFGVEIELNHSLQSLDYSNNRWTLNLVCSGMNKTVVADFVCIAAGGFPKAAHFDWLLELGHTIEPPVPSLFTFNMPQHPITKLMGVSTAKATIKILGTKLSETGAVLITHWGLSGPAILKLSAWGARYLADVDYCFSIAVNWLVDYSEHTLRSEWTSFRQEYAPTKIGSKNPFGLSNRLWLFLLEVSGISEQIRWAELTSVQQNKLINCLTNYVFEIKGKTTFKEEFVTCGGIKLNEVDPNSMESKKVSNLYFAGEILDIDGITGGFNFQNAWTTGFIAAKDIARKALTLVDNNEALDNTSLV